MTTSTTRTAASPRTVAEIIVDMAAAYFYGNASTMLDAQTELIATLGAILSENFPSDMPIQHAARLATHATSAYADAKALANNTITRLEMSAAINAARIAGDASREAARIARIAASREAARIA